MCATTLRYYIRRQVKRIVIQYTKNKLTHSKTGFGAIQVSFSKQRCADERSKRTLCIIHTNFGLTLCDVLINAILPDNRTKNSTNAGSKNPCKIFERIRRGSNISPEQWVASHKKRFFLRRTRRRKTRRFLCV